MKVVLLLLFCSLATGLPATFYVATTGSDANPGTLVSPFLQLRHALSVYAEGDTVLLRGGNYPGDGVSVSEFKSNTTIKSYPGELATFQATNDVANMWRIGGVSNVTIGGGIDLFGYIQSSAVLKIDAGSHDIVIVSNIIRGCHDGHGLLNSPVANNYELGNLRIEGNWFFTNGCDALISDSPLHQVYLQTSSNYFGSNFVMGISNVIGNGYGLHAFMSGGSNLVVRGNTFTNCGGAVGIVGSSFDNAAIYNNVTISNESWGIDVRNSTRILVANNTSYRDTAGITFTTSTNSQIWNNIIVSAVNNDPGGIWIHDNCDGISVIGNLACSNSIADYRVQNSYNISTNGNLFGVQYAGNSSTKVTNSLAYNPRFTNPSLGILTLTTGSSAVDTGTNVVGITVDYDNKTRGHPPDMGAYEFYPRAVSVVTANVGTIATP